MRKKTFFILIHLNGYKYKIFSTQPFQIYDLLQFLNYQKELIILEHNGKITNYFRVKSKYIKQSDEIEIITIVGGG